MSVKKPRPLSLARAKGTSTETVAAYFEELGKILAEHDLIDKPQFIYNVDEKGLSDDHNPPSVVTDVKCKPYSVTSGRSSMVTVLGCGNALGSAIPPYFVFPGKRMRAELLEGASTGASGTVSDSGWSNNEVFLKYLQDHFLQFVQERVPAQPFLLLYDGHKSHVTLNIIDWAKENNIVLFVLPPHTSHVLQPLDVGCFGPFQNVYNHEKSKFMRENNSSTVPKHSLCKIACKAYNSSLTACNLQSSFRKCGIFPFRGISAVDPVSFAPSAVFEAPATTVDPVD